MPPPTPIVASGSLGAMRTSAGRVAGTSAAPVAEAEAEVAGPEAGDRAAAAAGEAMTSLARPGEGFLPAHREGATQGMLESTAEPRECTVGISWALWALLERCEWTLSAAMRAAMLL